MMGKIVKWNDKYAAGWCSTTTSGEIKKIHPSRDVNGGFTQPYVNLPSGKTIIIKPGDKVEIKDKKVFNIIRDGNALDT